ncbi:MAG: HD domain-containing phosphohydrolase [Ancalomicrobiaceae bacterium]|nr:HD domain-containing phosphohydrolase [Ancalomicrobiaceae bacterium]
MSVLECPALWNFGRSGDVVDIKSPDTLPLRPKLAFAGAAYEQEFTEYYRNVYYRYAQASLAVGLMLIFCDFLVDLIAFGDVSANNYRVQLCLPILAGGLAYSFTQFARRHWQIVMSGFIAVVATSLFWVLLAIDGQGGMGLKSWVGILNFVFLEFYCFVILGVQFRYALASGLIILLMFEAAMLYGIGNGGNSAFYWSYHVVTLFLLAAAVGWWREFVLRKDFATRTALTLAKDRMKDQNELLEIEVEERTRKIQHTQDVAVEILASLAETRDNETGNHIRRTQNYVKALALKLQSHPAFAAYLVDCQIDILFKHAPLHDIGKVGIRDSILLKPGSLDPEEFEIMKTHTAIGHRAIETAERRLGMSVEFLACAKEIALNHHERWDGTGYPNGLSGNAIPISARLMAVADVYDALTSRRVYKDAIPHDQAIAIMLEGRGRHFDPNVIDAFAEISDEFRDIADRYSDSELLSAAPARLSARVYGERTQRAAIASRFASAS